MVRLAVSYSFKMVDMLILNELGQAIASSQHQGMSCKTVSLLLLTRCKLLITPKCQAQLVVAINQCTPKGSLCTGIIGFSLTDFGGVPPPAAIVLGGILGIIGWAAHMD